MNPNYETTKVYSAEGLTIKDMIEAEERLKRFAPYIEAEFPETSESKGIIESPLRKIDNLKTYMENINNTSIKGRLLLKCDSHLPISGSIKARGGIYEVLKHAEDLALAEGMLSYDEDYSILKEEKFKKFFPNTKLR